MSCSLACEWGQEIEREDRKKNNKKVLLKQYQILLNTRLRGCQISLKVNLSNVQDVPRRKIQFLMACLCSSVTTPHFSHLIWHQSGFAMQMIAQLWLSSGFESIVLHRMVLYSGINWCCWWCMCRQCVIKTLIVLTDQWFKPRFVKFKPLILWFLTCR